MLFKRAIHLGQDAAFCRCGGSKLPCICGHSGQDLLFRHIEHRERFDVNDLAVAFQHNLVARFDLRLA